MSVEKQINKLFSEITKLNARIDGLEAMQDTDYQLPKFKYPCRYCNVVFSTKNNLHAHLKIKGYH